ncbi:MAG: hypothetical protein KC643_20540 [Nitrospira sp.]|nr:hypothetical protein [Nitrospira sp.]
MPSLLTVTFTGAHTRQENQQEIAVGASPGSFQFGTGTLDAKHQFTVTGLPSTGTLYVRYYTYRVSATVSWETQTYTYSMRVGSTSTSQKNSSTPLLHLEYGAGNHHQLNHAKAFLDFSETTPVTGRNPNLEINIRE